MSKKWLGSLIVAGLLAVAAAISKSECTDEECYTVDRSEKYVTDVLIQKYGLDPDTARSLAEDLLSGDYEKAENAVKKMKELGALNDVLEVINKVTGK